MTVIIKNNGIVEYYPRWQTNLISIDSVTNLLKWRSDKIKIFGKEYDQARMVAWYGEPNICYKYSGIEMITRPWTPELLEIKKNLENFLNVEFNSVLINLYRDGEDYMGWHSDDEKELGDRPIIASLSLGVPRDFIFKHKVTGEKISLNLKNGDLLVMKGETQKYWKHALPKRLKIKQARLNLTFRFINRI